jgi:hypothetical protein
LLSLIALGLDLDDLGIVSGRLVLSQANKTWPNQRMGASGPSLDIVARAEAALKALAGQFARWLQDEIDKLDAARARVGAEGLTGDAGEALYLHAHDLKGLGGTYEFPIITRIAGSLCNLLEEPGSRGAIPLTLIDAHIEAIKTMVLNDIRDELHPVGGTLAAALENQVHAAR